MKQKGVIVVLCNGKELPFEGCAYCWDAEHVEIYYGLNEELVANFDRRHLAGVFAFGVED